MLIILNTPFLHVYEYKLLSELKVMSASKNVPSQKFWRLIMFQFYSFPQVKEHIARDEDLQSNLH